MKRKSKREREGMNKEWRGTRGKNRGMDWNGDGMVIQRRKDGEEK